MVENLGRSGMKATVQWNGDVRFSATSESGHTLKMDGPAEHGGNNVGARPMELVLIGLGGCTAFDVVHILQKGRQDITNCGVEVSALRADKEPKVFTDVHVQFILTGHKLNPTKVKRAIDLSAQQYCSASIMMQRGGVRFTHDYEIRETP
jgi:putative redox protein|tara:strand:+ start:10043 stop:10492 length:450 start_codon:yes stop_codon:yes gene_type:complete